MFGWPVARDDDAIRAAVCGLSIRAALAESGGDESLEVRWWPLDDLPPLAPHELTLIQHALSPDPMPIFATGPNYRRSAN